MLLKYRSGLPEALAIGGWYQVGRLWNFFKGVLKQRGQRENLKVRWRGDKACGWEMGCRSSGHNLAELKAAVLWEIELVGMSGPGFRTAKRARLCWRLPLVLCGPESGLA